MKLTKEQIYMISSNILLKDIKSYINANREDYEKFLQAELCRNEK